MWPLRGWLLGVLAAGASESLFFLNTVPLTPSEVSFLEPFSAVFIFFGGGRGMQLQQESPAEAAVQALLSPHASWAPSLSSSLLATLMSQNSSCQKKTLLAI